MESSPKSWSPYVDKMASAGGKLFTDLTDATLDVLDDLFSEFVRKL